MEVIDEMKSKNLRLLGLIVLALAACLGSFAQSVSGDLAGTIYDASGATIPNATITAKNDATGVETTTKSAATGEYHLGNLPPGTYTVTVTAPGFTKAQLRAVAVTLRQITTENVKLDVGSNVETVEVSAAAAAIDTTTASVQTSFETRNMSDLPIASGGTEFHGSAYEYLQNRNLNAADNQSALNGDQLHPRYDSNRFGGSVGGPIKKNKIFFYGLYEYIPTGTSSTPGALFAPTAAGYATLGAIPGINPTNLSQMKLYLGTAPSAAPQASTPNGAYPLVGPANQALGWTAAQ